MGEIIYQGPSPFRLIPAATFVSAGRAQRRRSDCLRIRSRQASHACPVQIPMAIDDAKELGRQMIASAEMAEKER